MHIGKNITEKTGERQIVFFGHINKVATKKTVKRDLY